MTMRLPAEWQRQQMVLFTFPRRQGDWGKHLKAVSTAIIQAANAVNKVTPALLLVADEEYFANYEDGYEGEWIAMPTDDCWVRDYGPICTFFGPDEVLVLNDFVFNGWGNKFEAVRDTAVPQRLWRAEFPEAGYRTSELVLEGGSLESDGQGTIITTRKCWLSKNRNDWSSMEEARTALEEYFDIEQLLWLEHGELAGDDTDAHVDTLARFLDAETIAYVQCSDESDEHYRELQLMEVELKAFRQTNGEPYKLIPLPLPNAITAADGHRLPATYANFLISNGAVFVPTYFKGKQTDKAALQVFEEYGKYKVVAVDSRSFIEEHGSLHCLTMQIPL